jgi:hypothetical protein
MFCHLKHLNHVALASNHATLEVNGNNFKSGSVAISSSEKLSASLNEHGRERNGTSRLMLHLLNQNPFQFLHNRLCVYYGFDFMFPLGSFRLFWEFLGMSYVSCAFVIFVPPGDMSFLLKDNGFPFPFATSSSSVTAAMFSDDNKF